jgi:hypothetical protein
MTNNKSDIIIAIFLLCFSGVMINDASNIRDLGFEGLLVKKKKKKKRNDKNKKKQKI